MTSNINNLQDVHDMTVIAEIQEDLRGHIRKNREQIKEMGPYLKNTKDMQWERPLTLPLVGKI